MNLKCFFGFHKLGEPIYYAKVAGKVANVPRNISVCIKKSCKNCIYVEFNSTEKRIPYDNYQKTIKEMNRKKTKLEKALQ